MLPILYKMASNNRKGYDANAKKNEVYVFQLESFLKV